MRVHSLRKRLVILCLGAAMFAPAGAASADPSEWPIQPSSVVSQPTVEGPIPHGVGTVSYTHLTLPTNREV